MRMIQCHIENFGKLSDQTISFDEPLCVLNRKNGWGKSTLATFIKVMFYGFSNESKRSGSIIERERLHYQPWQGGIYGGQLTFEVDGNTYEINRVFGKKEKEDQFTLTDLSTNLISEAYSSRIGDELFQINQESFLKTIFIPQDACESSCTDSINAKMGNLTDSLDDINRHNLVQETIKSRLNELSPRRSTGWLKKMNTEIAGDKESLRSKESLQTTIHKLDEASNQAWNLCQKYSNELLEVRKQFCEAGEQKELAAKREAYADKVKNWKQQVVLYEETRAYFGKNVPTEEMIANALANHRRLLVARQSGKDASLTEAERAEFRSMKEYFENGVPGEEEIKNAATLAERLAQLELTIAKETASSEEQKELIELRKKFEENPPEEIDSLIEKCDLQKELKAGLAQRRSTLVSLKKLEEQQEQLRKQQAEVMKQQLEENRKQELLKKQMMFLIPGFVLLLIGIFCLMWQPYVALGVIALGIIVLILSFIWKQKHVEEPSVPMKNIPKQEKTTPNVELERLENEIRLDEENIREIEVLLREFFEDYDLIYSETKAMDVLYQMKGEWNRYRQLCKEDAAYARQGYEENRKSLKEQLHVLLDSYYPDAVLHQGNYGQLCVELEKKKQKYLQWSALITKEEKAKRDEKIALEELMSFYIYAGRKESNKEEWNPENMGKLLEEICNQQTTLIHREKELERAKREKEEFEHKNDIQQLRPVQNTRELQNTEELSKRISDLEALLEEKNQIRKSYARQLDEALEKLGVIEEIESMLVKKEEDYQKKKQQYALLEKTSEYLEKAKEQFLAKYMDPVKGAFDKYYQELSDVAGEFRMDANISLTMKEAGAFRDPEYFSQGTRDLTAICLRLALIHAMYQKEKPFLLIDDAFVNLDGDKVELAKKFLVSISKEYQVIYFTCHESRALKKEE